MAEQNRLNSADPEAGKKLYGPEMIDFFQKKPPPNGKFVV
jgi:hypothetical protein